MEQEMGALQPLPSHPYDTSEVALRTCRFDGLIEFESNFYSLPFEYGGEILAMKATENEIFIYSSDLTLIGYHERVAAGMGEKIEKPEHRGSKKVRYGLEPVRDTFLAVGDAAELFLKGLKEKYPRLCGFHVRYILQLKEEYHCEDINKALSHAIRYYAFDCKSIERILKAKAQKRRLESYRCQKARERLKKVLPRIKQRGLDEYRILLYHEEEDNEEK